MLAASLVVSRNIVLVASETRNLVVVARIAHVASIKVAKKIAVVAHIPFSKSVIIFLLNKCNIIEFSMSKKIFDSPTCYISRNE